MSSPPPPLFENLVRGSTSYQPLTKLGCTLCCGELETSYKTQDKVSRNVVTEKFSVEIIGISYIKCETCISHKFPILFPSCVTPCVYLLRFSGGTHQQPFHIVSAIVLHSTVLTGCKSRSRFFKLLIFLYKILLYQLPVFKKSYFQNLWIIKKRLIMDEWMLVW